MICQSKFELKEKQELGKRNEDIFSQGYTIYLYN